MTPERWRQVKDTLDAAVSLQGEVRAAYLASACRDDDDLRREVESLLASHESAGASFLQAPIFDLASPADEPVAPSPRVGRRIGAYDLLEEIGRGGMGEVYRAVRADGHFRKQVALKLVRTGFATDFIVERFRYERQILADLDHPNIARLLDGGTTSDGVPYLVMELVDGVPVDVFCDQRCLDVTGRLRLFLQICAAVQYAHQRLIVHRDIKPTNVLVTTLGTPKLLDFGIAKMLDAGQATDVTLARPMTLEYASPEQIRGEPITTAADVYALGVVLYRLLTGRSPYRVDARAPHDLSMAITSTDPDLPSTVVARAADADRQAAERLGALRATSLPSLRRRLSGDIDQILLKALRKEPARRYSSVEQFGDDIENHLQGRPVIAAHDSWRYRAGKFVGRHRLGLAAAAALLLVIVAGAGVSIYQARRARREQAIAQQRFDMVRRLANAVVFEFNDALQSVPGTTAARKLIVTRATEYLDSLSQQQATDIALTREVAGAYVRIGDILGNPYYPNLGDTPGALSAYRRALALYERLVDHDPGPETRSGLAHASVGLGSMLWGTGDANGARTSYSRALNIYAGLAERETAYRQDEAAASYFLGQTELRFGEAHAAGEHYERAQREFEAIVAANPTNVAARRSLALAYTKLADVCDRTSDYDGALRQYRRAADQLEALLSAQPSSNDLRRLAANIWIRIANTAERVPPSEREADARRAVSMLKPLAEADPSNAQAGLDLASAERSLGDALGAEHRNREASDVLTASLRDLDGILAVNPGYLEARSELGYTHHILGTVAWRTGDRRAALHEYEQARAILEAPVLARQSPKSLAELYGHIGDVYATAARDNEAGARDQAASWYQKSEEKWAEIAGGSQLSADETRDRRDVARKVASLGRR